MWEAGSAKNRSGDRDPVAAPGQGSDAALVFSRFPTRERTRSGHVAGMSGGCLVSRQHDPGTYVDET